MIDELISKGKNLLLVLGLAGLVGCSTTYAKRDYNQYPAYSRDIALYNMREIAKDICSERKALRSCFSYCNSMTIDESGLTYVRADPTRSYDLGGSVCHPGGNTTTHYLSWSQLRKVIPGNRSIKACQEGGDCVEIVKFDNEQQTNDFAEAMSIYAGGNSR